MSDATSAAQRAVCQRFGQDPLSCAPNLKVGVSRNVMRGAMPIHGLRHIPSRDTCGWYIWAGEDLSTADDFFQPLHVAHLVQRRPEVERYLALPAGWRFLIGPGYEDVWEDSTLLVADRDS